MQQVLQTAGDKTAVIAMGNPYLALNFPGVTTYICTYSNAPTSERSAVKLLFGEMQVKGKLPEDEAVFLIQKLVEEQVITLDNMYERFEGREPATLSAIERTQATHQHEVQAAVAAGALQRRLVCRRLDHAQLPRIARRIAADRARNGIDRTRQTR